MQFLFRAFFKSGLEFSQNPEDISPHNPEKSCFWDVLQAIDKGEELWMFLLSDGNISYLVDLRDGAFEVNGSAFYFTNDVPVSNRRLIYFRRVTQHMSNDGLGGQETVFQQVIQLAPN